MMELTFKTTARFSENLSHDKIIALMEELVGLMSTNDLRDWWEVTVYQDAVNEMVGK